MRGALRFALEVLLLMLLAGALLLGAIAAIRHFVTDEKMQYFLIGYYVAIHSNLATWIWKKLGGEKSRLK